MNNFIIQKKLGKFTQLLTPLLDTLTIVEREIISSLNYKIYNMRLFRWRVIQRGIPSHSKVWRCRLRYEKSKNAETKQQGKGKRS